MKSVQLLWHPPTRYIGFDTSYVCVPFVEIGNIAGVTDVTTGQCGTYLTFTRSNSIYVPFPEFSCVFAELGYSFKPLLRCLAAGQFRNTSPNASDLLLVIGPVNPR